MSKCQKRIALAEEIKKQAREMTHTMATSTSIQLFTEFLKLFNSLAQVKCSYGNCKK